VEALKNYVKKQNSYYILGKGTKLLINPNNKATDLIKISSQIIPIKTNENIIWANAAISSSKLLQICQEKNLSGLEFTAGIPASVGGMVAMNFGAFEQNIGNVLNRLRIIDEDGKDYWLEKKDLSFSYRKGPIAEKKSIILEAEFVLQEAAKATIKNNIKTNIAKRKQTQPIGEKTFGCIFKNPHNGFAGQILENLGYKGLKYKNMMISQKHANFLVNLGNSDFSDITDFIYKLKTEVKERTGIELDLEVKIIG
jgi:UDP-N-acetylmuramate dehydrogenase